jgi:hypothetical protein
MLGSYLLGATAGTSYAVQVMEAIISSVLVQFSSEDSSTLVKMFGELVDEKDTESAMEFASVFSALCKINPVDMNNAFQAKIELNTKSTYTRIPLTFKEKCPLDFNSLLTMVVTDHLPLWLHQASSGMHFGSTDCVMRRYLDAWWTNAKAGKQQPELVVAFAVLVAIDCISVTQCIQSSAEVPGGRREIVTCIQQAASRTESQMFEMYEASEMFVEFLKTDVDKDNWGSFEQTASMMLESQYTLANCYDDEPLGHAMCCMCPWVGGMILLAFFQFPSLSMGLRLLKRVEYDFLAVVHMYWILKTHNVLPSPIVELEDAIATFKEPRLFRAGLPEAGSGKFLMAWNLSCGASVASIARGGQRRNPNSPAVFKKDHEVSGHTKLG